MAHPSKCANTTTLKYRFICFTPTPDMNAMHPSHVRDDQGWRVGVEEVRRIVRRVKRRGRELEIWK